MNAYLELFIIKCFYKIILDIILINKGQIKY